MPGLIPFEACVARPDEGDRRFPLPDHLRETARLLTEGCTDREVEVLYKLQGLCHDIYKAHPDWQAYVNSRGAIRKGPAHAAAGAFLFSWLAWRWLDREGKWPARRLIWVRMAADIADHHGQLGTLVQGGRLSWVQQYEWERLDMDGIRRFLLHELPELQGIPLLPPDLSDWVKFTIETVKDLQFYDLDPEEAGDSPLERMRHLQEWRRSTTRFIAADRFSIQAMSPGYWKPEEADRAQRSLETALSSVQRDTMHELRSRVQAAALRRYRECGSPDTVTVGLPTGYGKTLLALRLALDMIREESRKKIIYVAPYLSLLEQASGDVQHWYGFAPLEHHSLAIHQGSGVPEVEEPGHENGFASRVMESWAHPVVCTSFQQFCRALFPDRAQHTLRRAWLDDSIVIIDEPQIFRPEGWNLFLTGLEALQRIHRLKVMFLSATMPPTRYGLSIQPVELCPDQPNILNRYRLECSTEPCDQADVAKLLMERREPTRCAILNTVRDAQLVYEHLKEAGVRGSGDLLLLHGGMIPLHKKVQIGRMQERLKRHSRLTVVATQIIEAGVNVSFRFLYRAAAILPSIVQAAGRVNRHAEADQGIVLVRPFLRDGDKDTRSYIYKQQFLRQLTDELLYARTSWEETELRELLTAYFDRMFRHNTYEACLQRIEKAYAGDWTALGLFEPFENDALRLPLFVPWNVPEEAKAYVPEHYRYLMQYFNMANADEIYERYTDRDWLRKLSFEDRKNFMILFHYHVVNLPGKMAIKLADSEAYLQHRIPCLHGARGYRDETGMAAVDDPEWQFY
ncbi:MAG: CRISPR-associated helicase Cas3' [Bacillus thermozeamaize]|uniref:CRISPR-associated helicase Cas3 n=1 Tax=Bacillus thermozeamaize TaxID=230954 RepID=A0A1Y3PIP1_9BACI|nr:MAG: CRISPR-associated helicase Cas3' [Bacillus thermozeamaize]